MDDPQGFLAAYVKVVDGVARALAPPWHATRRLLARESEQIAMATAAADVHDGARRTGLPHAPLHGPEGLLR
ncbi:hypothetical protein [Streptomyces sp. NPDC050704]|uniref:hypothetical protein n=1 Tax=Streptomyces sp. NPDC050704 TaxID=3157219 RepID=UPI003448347A